MRVNVIGKSNGVGLSRDLELMASALRGCGCDVEVTAIDSRDSHRRRSRMMQFGVQLRRSLGRPRRGTTTAPPHDLNVMLEHIWTQFLERARRNVAVPNPEWFDRHDARFRRSVNCIWAKTENTQRIFERLGSRAVRIGFDSEDRYQPEVIRESIFFHLAGKSTMKGTTRLVELWLKHPEWPKLIVVWHAENARIATSAAANLEIHTEYFDDIALRRLQNRCLFHVCTSETEGWGHYLVEAMSVRAITITLDAPPMNELVTPVRGVLIDPHQSGRQKLAELYRFDEDSLVTAVHRLLGMSSAEISTLSESARNWFLENKAGFNDRIGRALDALEL